MGYSPITPEEFFALIWPKRLLNDERLEMRIFSRLTNGAAHIECAFHRSVDSFLKDAREREDNVFFGVATRFHEAGKKQDCYRVCCSWVDFDHDILPKKIKPQPDILVESGGGFHLYWLLPGPVYLRQGKWREVEQNNRILAKGLKSDKTATDISRILRVPGHFNFKYSPPREVKAFKLKT